MLPASAAASSIERQERDLCSAKSAGEQVAKTKICGRVVRILRSDVFEEGDRAINIRAKTLPAQVCIPKIKLCGDASKIDRPVVEVESTVDIGVNTRSN